MHVVIFLPVELRVVKHLAGKVAIYPVDAPRAKLQDEPVGGVILWSTTSARFPTF
jgi:hypothetical protein